MLHAEQSVLAWFNPAAEEARVFQVLPARDDEAYKFLIHVEVHFERDREDIQLRFLAVALDKGRVGDETETDHVADPIGALEPSP